MPLKIIIAGSRRINNYDELILALRGAISNNLLISEDGFEVVSGGAIGVDTLARRYALESNYKLTEMKPIYDGPNDRSAPLRRNVDIANYGDILIAVWDGKSTGTNHIINYMKKIKKPVYVHIVQF